MFGAGRLLEVGEEEEVPVTNRRAEAGRFVSEIRCTWNKPYVFAVFVSWVVTSPPGE